MHPVAPPSWSQHTLYGVALVVAAAFTISVQDVVFKLFSSAMPLWQIFAVRGALALPMFLILDWSRGGRVFIEALQPWVLLRGTAMTLTFLAFYAGVPFLNLSTLGAANYVAPIFVALLSAYVIGQPVGRSGWAAVLVGFVGVIVLLRPGSDAFSPWALLPLMGAFFYAVAHILTRAKCQDVPIAAMALAVILATVAAGVVIRIVLIVTAPAADLVATYPFLLGGWAPISASQWLTLTVLAGFTIVIALLLAGGYRAAPPSTAATLEYSYLVFVALWDVLIFAAALSAPTLLGIVLIFGAGVLVLHRDKTAADPARK